MTSKPVGKLADVTGKAVSIDPAAHYDDWAATYNADLVETYGYSAPAIGADALAPALPDREAPVIDVGCGTGLVGAALTSHGFANIDGIDISGGMLAKARATGLYRTLIHHDAATAEMTTQRLYAGVISVGSFGLGHLGAEALEGLVRLGLPDATVIVFMNAEPFSDQDYAATLKDLQERQIVTDIEVTQHNYMSALDRPGKLIKMQRSRSVG